MTKMQTNIVIIGGGPAGMAAAVAAFDAGERDILILEREQNLGGILRQCIHNGFGLHRFGEELTGPEYASRYVDMVNERKIRTFTDTSVLSITKTREITATNAKYGIFHIQAGAIILAMGCRERPRGALSIPGTRPAGVYTAGEAQKFVNLMGLMPGREVVILGSGDIGLIMARRMTLEGAKVKAIVEIMPYSLGLSRNIEQCVRDFDIPLLFSHTVGEIHGKNRISGVTVVKVDEKRHPCPNSEQFIPCDTLLLSCGLIPENELSLGAGIKLDPMTGGATVNADRETNIPGFFACGNVLHVHDLVDYVSEEASFAGVGAVNFLRGLGKAEIDVSIVTDGKIRYTVPEMITRIADTKVYFRVAGVYFNAKIVVRVGDTVVISKKTLRLAPGEMQTLTLPASVLAEADGKTISFAVEEESR